MKVIDFLSIVYKDSGKSGFSFERWNRALRSSLFNAISSGFEFEKDDFVKLFRGALGRRP